MQLSITFDDSFSTQHDLVLQKVLGKGKFTVYHAKGTSSSVNLALKVFPQNTSSDNHFQRERHFLNKLQNHQNVIKFLPISQHTLKYNLLATEYTQNGDFFDFVTQMGMNDKKLIRTYFKQLIDGLEYIHSQQVAHLDLKLENILLDNDFKLKIFDFDQAQNLDDTYMKSGGTKGYRAPELIARTVKMSNLKSLDLFSTGVLLYTFMTGLMPFSESKTNATNKAASYQYFVDHNDKFWKQKAKESGVNFDDEIVELMNGLWNENAEKRWTIDQVKRSRWFNQDTYTEDETVVLMKAKFVKPCAA